ncbi:peptidase [Paucibacter sp. TC2R-5]|uniref:peptidase n=1 Tax=Paucibacter sp. TC2R-5 TaxID=2893555 RepID=UPI0021E45BA6|nr:peptidase [Paucibacter sp. TC2R-5]MCV2359638.1 peptidase [Paucibacter sp. TC2R-5]
MPAAKPITLITPTAANLAPATLQCFKPGRHTAMNGNTLQFAASDLAASAAAYDPALHEAPLVVGHPELDGPAYGWVSQLAFTDGALEATPQQVMPEFADAVNAGTYKKISAAFWSPNSPGNPVPGVYYLRHVGFLGGAAPAVKGMRTPTLTAAFSADAADSEGVVEFSEWDDVDNASLWRGLRDWLLTKFGAADADSAIPPYLVASVERGAQAELAAAQTAVAPAPAALPAFAAPIHPTEITVTPEEKATLEAENTRLRQELANAATAAAKARLDAAHAEGVAFAEGLAAQKILGSAEIEVVVSALDAIAAHAESSGAVLQFGEGEAKAPLLPAFKALLSARPPLVEGGMRATNGRAAGGEQEGPVAFAAPPGAIVRPERGALLVKVQDYQRAHPGTDFVAACRAVGA